ncbi:hypothetical protein R0J91_09955 [Micrococcus sp. SIMBA_131]
MPPVDPVSRPGASSRLENSSGHHAATIADLGTAVHALGVQPAALIDGYEAGTAR